MNLADITAIFCRYWSIFSKKYPWIINAIWKFFEKDQYYLFQSLCINKRIESFFFCENKSPGADEINFNIIKYCFGEVCGPFSHSTEHAIAQLADQIYESFENDNYTVGIFADLSKAFDTVDHTILLKSLKSMELRVQMLPGLDVT